MQSEPLPFGGLINLLSERLGARVLEANDEFFAGKENLVKDETPIFIPDKYTEQGKWMDGWETRRGRKLTHDTCLLKLGLPGFIKAVDIDTSFFLGNHPPYAAVEACSSPEAPPGAHTVWTTLLTSSPLRPGSHNFFCVEPPPLPAKGERSAGFTHLRLNIYPDGGVARFRAYGLVDPALSAAAQLRRDASGKEKSRKPSPQLSARTGGKLDEVRDDEEVDLIALEHGGLAVACSDAFFSPMNNLLQAGPSRNMGDGWETRRRRSEGFDWVIIKAAAPGVAHRLLVDTTHYKGNFPESCSIHYCFAPHATAYELATAPDLWQSLLPRTKLAADREHVFAGLSRDNPPFTHIKLAIYPDGGIARLRVFGHFARESKFG